MTEDRPRRQDWLVGAHRGDLAREHLLATAAFMFAQLGVDNVKVDDIAREAGCSRATLYRTVGGKSAIVDEVVSRNAIAVVARVAEAISAKHGTTRVVAAILASVKAIRADTTVMHMYDKQTSQAIRDYLASSDIPIFLKTLDLGLDEPGAHAFVRLVLSLVSWPLPTEQAEQHLIERIVRPAARDWRLTDTHTTECDAT